MPELSPQRPSPLQHAPQEPGHFLRHCLVYAYLVLAQDLLVQAELVCGSKGQLAVKHGVKADQDDFKESLSAQEQPKKKKKRFSLKH